MIRFYPLMISIVLFSCFSQNRLSYLGNSFKPTKTVDVYVDAAAIKKAYTIMGKSYYETGLTINFEKVQQLATEKAKEKGADAVLFQDYVIANGNSIETTTKIDTSGRTPIRVRTTTSTPSELNRVDILFLKYDQ